MATNTRLSYTYRDYNNFKCYGQVVVGSTVQWSEIMPYLDQGYAGLQFVPADLGLPHPGTVMETWPNANSDHPWCNFDESDLQPTTDLEDVSKSEFMDRLKKAKASNWPGQLESL